MPQRPQSNFHRDMDRIENNIENYINQSRKNQMKFGTIGSSIIAGIVVLTLLFAVGGSFYTVDQGEEAVILRNGAYVDTQGPGFHVKTPFIEGVEHISLRQNTFNWENMESYSNDQQPASIKLSVTIQANPGAGKEIYSQYGSIEGYVARVLTPRVPALFKNVFGQYTAENAIKQREKLNLDALEEIRTGVPSDLISVVSVQVEDIAFSQSYIDVIEQKQQATVEVQRRQQLLAQEQIQAQIVVTQAQAQADSQLAIATANAKSIVLEGDARAQAIDAINRSLANSPTYIDYVQAQAWDGKLPTTMPPNSTVPFLDIKPTQ